MLTFRVGSGEFNVEITFKEDGVTAKDAALEALRHTDAESPWNRFGDVLVVECVTDENKSAKKASVVAGAIFKTDQLVEELNKLGKSTFNVTIKSLDEYHPNLRLYIRENNDDDA